MLFSVLGMVLLSWDVSMNVLSCQVLTHTDLTSLSAKTGSDVVQQHQLRRIIQNWFLNSIP